MKRKKDGTFAGEVTPTRFKFTTEKLIYPLKITQLSVKDKTEALFYVQGPQKVDLPGDLTYQYQWVPMLQNAKGWYDKGTFGSDKLPGKGDRWLKSIRGKIGDLKSRGEEQGFWFENKTRPRPNKKGQTATALEWAKRLTASDIRLLIGAAPFTEKLPDVDQGFTQRHVNDPRIGEAVQQIIERRLAWCKRQRPGGYLLREAPAADIRQLRILAGHLMEGEFLTKFRKTFTRAEMDDDLLIVPAKVGNAYDDSEYEEILPTSPP
jgi:hypothetical protein